MNDYWGIIVQRTIYYAWVTYIKIIKGKIGEKPGKV